MYPENILGCAAIFSQGFEYKKIKLLNDILEVFFILLGGSRYFKNVTNVLEFGHPFATYWKKFLLSSITKHVKQNLHTSIRTICFIKNETPY